MIKQTGHIINKGNSLNNISFQAFSIDNDQLKIDKQKGEIFITLIQGNIQIFLNNKLYCDLGIRRSPFKDPASGLFVPANQNIKICSETLSEIAVTYSLLQPKTKNLTPIIINPSQIEPIYRGEKNYQRTVLNLLDHYHQADFLLIGETISKEGMWSSYPPHKHDSFVENQEHELEEIYYYKVENKKSFAFQSIYSNQKNFDNSFRIKNNSIVHIPYGYHPVSAPPDSNLYYLWMLCGNNRKLLFQSESF